MNVFCDLQNQIKDATVKLWDRRASATISKSTKAPKNIFHSWFGFLNGSSSTNNETIPIHRSIPSWCCASTYQPKCDAVRDICWSPFIDEGERGNAIYVLAYFICHQLNSLYYLYVLTFTCDIYYVCIFLKLIKPLQLLLKVEYLRCMICASLPDLGQS